jgi:hypothetical protein
MGQDTLSGHASLRLTRLAYPCKRGRSSAARLPATIEFAEPQKGVSAMDDLVQVVRDVLEQCRLSAAPWQCLQDCMERLANDPEWCIRDLLEVHAKVRRILMHVLNGLPPE